jgi:hypothetical protein
MSPRPPIRAGGTENRRAPALPDLRELRLANLPE